MTEIQNLQRVLLMMAMDIDSLCRQNGIKYYLEAGSALGAIRHHGFIPWDDDFDIIMDSANYERFISVCKEKLDKTKYCLQIGLVDWPSNFSKIRLLGTQFTEEIPTSSKEETAGIFIDIFRMDNVPSCKLLQIHQYVCAKSLLAYQKSQDNYYKTASLKKKLVLFLARILKLTFLRNHLYRCVYKYNSKQTPYLGTFFDRTTFKSAIVPKTVWGQPKYVQFETTQFPVAEKCEQYLTILYGDYETLPPIEERQPTHMAHIDFGPYIIEL